MSRTNSPESPESSPSTMMTMSSPAVEVDHDARCAPSDTSHPASSVELQLPMIDVEDDIELRGRRTELILRLLFGARHS